MKLIVASTPSGGIGYQNKLPWTINIQGDLARFKRLTDKFPVIMGRKTWDSLPVKPLPNRTNIVITSRPFEEPGVTCLDQLLNYTDFYWLIGGANLIEQSWSNINEVHLTRVYEDYPCDAFINLEYLEYNFTRKYCEVFPDHTYEIWTRK